MKLHLRKGHKYYNMQSQLTLFGNESLICSWGSINNKNGNHKIINCNKPGDIVDNLKRIINIKKNRGYNIAPASNSKIENHNMAVNDIEKLILLLDNPEQFKIIQKYQKPDFYKIDDSVPKLIGVFLDTETTGLSHSKDKILELGMIKFEYCKDGYVYKILDEFNDYQDPCEPIADYITELTGITDEMVKGKNIDEEIVAKFLENTNLIIAHNAAFDRPFFEKMFPSLTSKAWGCSKADVNWKEEKLESQKLEYLAYKYNFFYEGHRAVIDCLAGLHLLAQNLPISKKPVLKELLTNCHKTRYKIWAKNAPYETKDLLKAKNYRWSVHPTEQYKAWMIEVFEDNLELELNFLRSHIYPTDCNIPVQTINAYNRFT